VEIRYQIPGVGHPDRPLFDVLAAAFEGHLQSVITEAGVEGTVDINTRVVHTSRFGVPASINIELVLEDALQIDKAEGALLAELRRLGEEPLPADVVLQARKQLRTEWYRTAVDPSALAFQIGHFEVMDSWRTLELYLEARDAATAEDLRELARKYFIANNRSVGVVLPEEVPQ
jgi:predicted Zn-dependent peptidase